MTTTFEGLTKVPEPSSRLLAVRPPPGAGRSASPRCSSCCCSGACRSSPSFGDFEIRTITAGTMALAFLAMAQAVVVISGGIDLSVGSLMVPRQLPVGGLDGGPGPQRLPAHRRRRAGRGRRPVDRHGHRHHRIGRAGHHRHVGGQLRARRAGAVRHRQPGRRDVAGLPAPRRRRVVGLAAVGAVDPRGACPGVDPAAPQPARPRRSSPSAATARRRSCRASDRPDAGARLLDRRLVRRLRRSGRHRIDRRRRAAGDDRHERHPQQRRRRGARWGGADGRGRWAPRAGAGGAVPDTDPGDHARSRVGPEQRRDGPRRDHHPRRARRRPAADEEAID